MTYPYYDTEYLLDQNYFQSSFTGTCSGTNATNYVPQTDLYYNWLPSSVYLPQNSDNQQQPIVGNPFKTSETSLWLQEPTALETNTAVYYPIVHRADLLANTENAKNYTCPNCHKQYCRKSTLKAHLKQHLDHRPFICQECGKSFSQAANLTAHKRVHTGEKPFTCPVCLRPFSQSSSLVTHKRTHTGERPYPCMHCEKAFTDSSTLTKHLRTHTGQKPYQCYLCLMQFTQSGNLHRHMRTHRNQQ